MRKVFYCYDLADHNGTIPRRKGMMAQVAYYRLLSDGVEEGHYIPLWVAEGEKAGQAIQRMLWEKLDPLQPALRQQGLTSRKRGQAREEAAEAAAARPRLSI
eukprot:gene30916-22603_t